MGSIIHCTIFRCTWNDQDCDFQYMNLSLNLFDINSIIWPLVTSIPNWYPKCKTIEHFLIVDSSHPSYSKSLSIHAIILYILQWICILDANVNCFHTCIPFWRFWHEPHRNVKESTIKAYATIGCPQMECVDPQCHH